MPVAATMHPAHASIEPHPLPVTVCCAGAIADGDVAWIELTAAAVAGVAGAAGAAWTCGDDATPRPSIAPTHAILRRAARVMLHLRCSSSGCPRTPRAMGPRPGSIVRNAAGRNAVEGNERLARPESHESVAGHPVTAGGGIMDLDGVGPASRRDDDEMTSFDPHERRKRELGEFRGIPSHGKDPKPGAERGGSEIPERGASRATCP